jgi:hypothetical protein
LTGEFCRIDIIVEAVSKRPGLSRHRKVLFRGQGSAGVSQTLATAKGRFAARGGSGLSQRPKCFSMPSSAFNVGSYFDNFRDVNKIQPESRNGIEQPCRQLFESLCCQNLLGYGSPNSATERVERCRHHTNKHVLGLFAAKIH